ncbi:MAG: hypothetical protein U1A22_12425 [Xanthomonadaceae bacterium]|nr:hypothetical protein [Xanthomonadaceae bacterium]
MSNLDLACAKLMRNTISSMVFFLALAPAAMVVSPCVGSAELTVRIDARTANGFEDGLTQMRNELTEPQQAQLTMALLKIRLDVAAVASDPAAPAEATTRADTEVRTRLHGLDYAEIIALAQLQETSNVAAMAELAGEWQLGTAGIAGTQAVHLSGDGRLSQPAVQRSVGRNYWYRSGERVGLSFNDGFATLLGTIASDGTMAGVGTSVQGARWRWTASREAAAAESSTIP